MAAIRGGGETAAAAVAHPAVTIPGPELSGGEDWDWHRGVWATQGTVPSPLSGNQVANLPTLIT